MINETYKAMLQGKSIIRELSEYATARGQEIGYENVFDYSLGNPSVPCTDDYTKAVIELHEKENPMALHGYSPSLGNTEVRGIVADSLNRRFGMDYEAKHIFMASGAAGALAHAIRCVTKPGDEILTFAPCFPEYFPYVNTTGAVLKVVKADTTAFQIDFDEFEKMMNPNVAAVLINSPNNPSGAVYSEETIKKLAAVLYEKQKEYGHDIFIISDEPYREIVFDGETCPYVSKYYDNTLSCYSFSKSLSLPGERIGYLVIPDEVCDSEKLNAAANVATRILGFVNAPTLQQKVVAKCINEKTDLSFYDKNRETLYNGLLECGFECIKPQGAFYLFVKSPIADEKEFCSIAKKYNLLLVPGSSFACPGYVRLAYCVSYETIVNSLPKFKELAKEMKCI